MNFLKKWFFHKKPSLHILEDYEHWFNQGFVKAPKANERIHRIHAIGDYVVLPGNKAIVNTGIRAELEPHELFMMTIYKPLSEQHNITLQNGIDFVHYENKEKQIRLVVRNEGSTTMMITTGNVIAEGVFMDMLSS